MAAYRSKLPTVDFSQQAYRGYLISVSALRNEMRISKDGHHICYVPPSQSWEWARKQIDALVE